MTNHYNDLTEAELERLAILAEECAETIHIIGKIIRHGYESYNPLDPSRRTNRELLEKEMGDVRYAMIALCEAGDTSKEQIHFYAKLKAKRITEYLHHQEEANP